MPDLFPSLRTKRAVAVTSTQGPRGVTGRKEILFAGYYPGDGTGGIMGVPGRQVDVERAVREGYLRVVWVYKAVDTIASNSARLPVQILQGKQPVEDHPLLRLLNGRANPIETGRRFRKRLSQQILLSPKGAFIEVTTARNGTPIRLDLLPPNRTRIIVSTGDTRRFTKPAGEVERYEVVPYGATGSVSSGQVRKIDPESVRWVGEPHPLDPYGCVTPLQAATLSAELSHFARLFNRQFMANDGRPGGILGVKDADENVDEGEMDRVERKFSSGPMEAGRLVVLAGGLDYIDVAKSPRDGSWSDTMDRSKDEILVAFGVPESQIGNASGRTYLNGAVDGVAFWTGAMRNHNDTVLSAFIDDVGDGLTVAFDVSDVDALHIAEQQRRQELREEFQVGLITSDYYAQETGRPVGGVPGTRVRWVMAGGIPVAQNPADQVAVERLAPVGTATQAAGMRGGAVGAQPDGQGDVGGLNGTGDVAAVRNGNGRPYPGTSAASIDAGDLVGAGTKALPRHPRDRKSGPARRPTPDDDKEDERVRARAEDALAASLRDVATRQVEVAVARLTGTKARKGTRHWSGPVPQTKSLDVNYVVTPDVWAEEADRVTEQTLAPLARGYGERMQEYLADDGVDTTEPQDGSSVPPMPLPGGGPDLDTHPAIAAMLLAARHSAADAARARAERMRERLQAAEEAGGTIEDLAAAIRGAAAEQHAAPGSGDALAALRGMGAPDAWARSVASTASSTALEGTRNAVLSAAGSRVSRIWRTREDQKVRYSHRVAEGQRVVGDERFVVGGEPARFPGDPDLSAAQRINCRCFVGYDLTGTETKTLRAGEHKAFDPKKHPRDAHGRFAKVGEVVRVLGGDHAGTVAQVVGTPDAGHVTIRTRTGDVTVASRAVERHTGPAPAGAPADRHHVATRNLVPGDRMFHGQGVVKQTHEHGGMTTVVTGRSGYRGQHVARYDADHVHVLDRRGPKAGYEDDARGADVPQAPAPLSSKGDDLPMPTGLSFVPAQGQTHARCRHGEILPVSKFPTMSGGRRGTECRAHRDERRTGQGVPTVTETDDRPEHIKAVEQAREIIGDPKHFGWRPLDPSRTDDSILKELGKDRALDMVDGFGPGARTLEHLDAMKRAGAALDAEAMRRAETRLRASDLYVDPEEDARISKAVTDLTDAEYRAAEGGYGSDKARAAFEARFDLHTRLGLQEYERKRLAAEAYREVLSEVTDLGGHEHRLLGTPQTEKAPPSTIKAGDRIVIDGEIRNVTAVDRLPAGGADLTVEGYPVPQRYGATARVDRVTGDGIDPGHEAAARWAEGNYPRSWLQQSGERGPIEVVGLDRGHYRPAKEGAPARIALSSYGARVQWPGQGNHDSVAVHEFAHRMEETVPGVQAAEWAYYWTRCGHADAEGEWIADVPKPLGGGYGAHEVTREDNWRDRYAGKVYGVPFEQLLGERVAEQAGPPMPQHPYEILTTGVQSLFAGEDYADEDHRIFTLGALAALSAPKVPVEPEKPERQEPEIPAHVTAVQRARSILPEDRREIGKKGRMRLVDDDIARGYQDHIDLYGLPEDKLRAALRKEYKQRRGYVPEEEVEEDIANGATYIARARESLDARLTELRQSPNYDPVTDTIPAMKYGRPAYDTRQVGQYEIPGERLNTHVDAVTDAGHALVAEIDRRLAGSGHEEAVTAAQAALEEAEAEAQRVNAEAVEVTQRRTEAYLKQFGFDRFTFPRNAPRIHTNARLDDGTFISVIRGNDVEKEYREVDDLGREKPYTMTKTVPASRVRHMTMDERAALQAEMAAKWTIIKAGLDRLYEERDIAGPREKAAEAIDARKTAREALDAAKDVAARARRDHTLAVLQEVRQFGAEGSRTIAIAKASTKEQEAAVRVAEGFYPTEWLDGLTSASTKGRGAITVTGAARGSYGYGLMKLSKGRKGLSDQGDFSRVAIHETGHLMEERVPGIKALEWAYHFRRTHEETRTGTIKRTGKNALRQMPGYSRREKSRQDDFTEPYTGKVYEDGPEGSWELLTTGAESLYAGSEYLDGDDDLRAFLLGLLAAL